MSIEVGNKLKGKVTGIKKFGAFVELPEGKSGLVHISEVADNYVENVEDHLSVGDEVEEAYERDDRDRERQRDSPEDRELARAIDAGGVEKLARNARGEVDIRQIDAKREEREWQDDRQRRPHEVHRIDLEEDRQHERRVRDEHHHEGRDEDRAAKPEVGLCQRVAGRN